jgi:uncharacterized membrane protein
MAKKVLIAGESWMSYTTHVKGFDSFYTTLYEEGVKYIRAAIEKAGYEVDFLPNHLAASDFPYAMEELKKYDCVILSDIGANTLLLPAETFTKSIKMPNRCQLIKDYVLEGGSLIMVGGYLTFSGVDAKGRWGVTPVQEVLPVKVLDIDDRMEHPEGIAPVLVKEHDVIKDVPKNWPEFLGYNKTVLLEGAEEVMTIGGDPFIAVGNYGKGKSAVFTSDCAPHWGPHEFIEWEGYDLLWKNMVDYLVK